MFFYNHKKIGKELRTNGKKDWETSTKRDKFGGKKGNNSIITIDVEKINSRELEDKMAHGEVVQGIPE